MTPFPDDGLCDFLFLESVTINEAGKLVSEVQLYDALRRLRTYAKTVTKTVAGISFSNRNLSAIISSMKSRKGSQEFKELRKDNVFGYGVLRATLHKSTSVKEVDDITTLFRALRKLQKRNKPSNTTEVPHGKSYVVLGMVILSEGTRAEKAHVRALFEDAISRNQLNALILRVDYNTDHHTDPKCRITGPNVWNGSYYEDQPTYANTLAFLKTVNYPKGIIVAFSLSTAAHFYQLPETNRTSVLGVGGRCVERTENGGLLTTRANVCDTDGVSQANSSVDPNSIQRYVVDSDEQGFFFVYDDISTVRTKMCLASKFNRKWRFSWAAVNIDMADDLSACNPNMTETFPTLRYMKSHMNGQFGKEACTKLVIE
ncbi:uncharacterized protein LOC135385974 [Ornithodoros turicata]|uniref:uncharacterized protein LOC135385974 n=1 Tax=Ornithodoros turicata TaxID=34597 RepID=UPI00313869EB